MGIRLVSKGNWDSTKRLLKKRDLKFIDSILKDYGAAGVSALSAETPYDTGKTAFAACMVVFVFPLFLLGTVTPSLAT